MASNPTQFQVEDQTDEDFFDKLVDDDFSGPTASGPKCVDGSDSDDAKAFANLSISDVGNAFEDSGGESGFAAKVEKGRVDVDPGVLGAHSEERGSLVSSSSIGYDSVQDSKNGVVLELTPSTTVSQSNGLESGNKQIGSELTVASTVGISNGSEDSGIKEVGWSSFHADAAQNGVHGFGSYSDFFSELGNDSVISAGDSLKGEKSVNSGNEECNANDLSKLVNYAQYQEDQPYEASMDQSTTGHDMSSSQYWETLYPGWKFDSTSGQWYQVEGSDAAANIHGSVGANSTSEVSAVSDEKMEVSYMQQTAQSVVGTVSETSTTGTVSNWNQPSQGTGGYPEHMYFDPQYPDWYYDTITQEWKTFESYNLSIQSTSQGHGLQNQNGFLNSSYARSDVMHGDYKQTNNFGLQRASNQGQNDGWLGSYNNNSQPSLTNWQTEALASEAVTSFGANHQLDNSYASNVSVNNDQQKSFSSFGAVPLHQQPNQSHGQVNGSVGVQSFVPRESYSHFNPANFMQNEQTPFSNDNYGSQRPMINFQQSSLSVHQPSTYASSVGRSSAGRPPHALVTFGFGGKLIVAKASPFGNLAYGNQDHVGGSISVLNLMEAVIGKAENSSLGAGGFDYFHALCQQSFPGPLVGGSVGNKELNKWIDERVANCESSGMEYRKAEVLRLLLNLLKIACQHYGKLRSPFGTDTTLKENDTPEAAVAKLFTSAKRSGAQFNEYGNLCHCLQKLPSEEHIRATAAEVQNLLVSGRKKEALECAQEGQLWGPALVLASQLGDQFYVDTVKQMALRQLVAGSPLRTLCLLIAGQPAEVFSMGTTANSFPSSVNMAQNPLQYPANSMLDDWEENLAVISANRTKDDELVIIHLGDCLWKERSEITAAHICYLVAEANFESYSDSARICLIGADHWKSPRTYASPDAIQRTELYEYSKVLGNSQFILLPFQPYKLVYAYMLAEVGKISDSLKYCQAVLKSLKTGRAPEVETWKQLVLSLEERIRMHQQGGYTANLAPAKLVGKLMNFFDNTAHRVIGGLPPPAPSTSHGSVQGNEHYPQPYVPRVSTSQSTMAMSSLVPSASGEWTTDENRMTMPNRSVSEPDFGRTPRQEHVDSSKENMSADGQGKASDSGRASRFPRFGFGSQLLQKTVGLVMRPRQGRQAKLGEKNKFYYDEKLKRWVEEGAEPPAEEAAPPPPPTTAAFQNGMSDYNLKSALAKELSPTNGSPDFRSPPPAENTSGMPPIPPSSNQFSARGRMGVRSRYVDTFNQGTGSSANLFQSPPVPSVKPPLTANAKFFIPSPLLSGEQAMESIAENSQEDTTSSEIPSTSTVNNSFQSPAPLSSASMQRFPSMGNIPSKGVMTNDHSSFSSNSRRTASWSGSFSDSFSPPPKMSHARPLGEALGVPPSSSFMPSEPSLMRVPMNGGSFGDLHEVEL